MLKKNIIANLSANAFNAIVSIICIPIYVHYLGVESYGLIGIFASMQLIFSVLDMGLSATLNREFARLSVVKDGAYEQKNLLRTFEFIYFGIAICIGLLVILSAPFIARYWLNNNSLSPTIVRNVLIQMGVLLALRWPTALYAGGLTGLQKLVTYNAINTIGEFIKALGSIAVLAFISNNITSFFYWQIIITALVVLALHITLWKKIPLTFAKPVFLKSLLIKNKNFASGMGGTSLAVIILTQTDKVVLSKILDLKTFGYFTLASAIASSLYRIIMPVSQAVYPRLVQLVESNNKPELIKLFHTSSQFIAAIVLPFALTISFFSKEVILIWTRDVAITEAVHPLVRVIIIGTACNALVTIPYMLQLAYGWTKLGFYQNVVAIIILIPSIIYLTNLYGAYGAVWCWAILNASYLFFSMPIMFKKIITTEQWNWYWNDIIKPLFWAALILGIGKLILNHLFIEQKYFLVGYIFFFGVLCFSTIAYFTSNIRSIVTLFLNRSKWKYYNE